MDMTDREVNEHWFKGAEPSEFRALRDYFTDDAIIAMSRQGWRNVSLTDSCWRAIDEMLTEEGM